MRKFFGYGGVYMVSYEPLWKHMKKKNITTYMLIYKCGFSSRTIYNLKHNKGITLYTLEKLCKVLECTPNDIVCFCDYDEKSYKLTEGRY